ncbi:MAG: GxxExxY protein [Patescibacteria group bacterium]
MAELIYPVESFDLIGCAFNVYKELQYGYHEKYYQQGYAIELEKKGYKFLKELPLLITYGNEKIGRYFLDFLVDDKIVVELKVGNEFQSNHIKQVLSYLKISKKRLGLLILFSPTGIKYKRIVN